MSIVQMGKIGNGRLYIHVNKNLPQNPQNVGTWGTINVRVLNLNKAVLVGKFLEN